VTVVFDKTYSIIPSAGTGGDISPDTEQIIPHGEGVAFTMTADQDTDFDGDGVVPDYTIVLDVFVDGGSVADETSPNCPVAGSSSYTFTNVTDDHTIVVEFTDFGDDCSTAVELCCTVGEAVQHVTRSGELNPVGDYDYFEVVTHEVGTLKVYTTGNTDTYGYLLNTDCSTESPIGESDNRNATDLNFYIERQDFPAGTYYVAVRHWEYNPEDPIGTGPYTLHVEFSADDHGSDIDNATSVSCDSSITGEIDTGGDVDYFALDISGDGLVTVSTTGSTDTYGVMSKVIVVGLDEVEIVLSRTITAEVTATSISNVQSVRIPILSPIILLYLTMIL
jgi:hypothetical protein